MFYSFKKPFSQISFDLSANKKKNHVFLKAWELISSLFILLIQSANTKCSPRCRDSNKKKFKSASKFVNPFLKEYDPIWGLCEWQKYLVLIWRGNESHVGVFGLWDDNQVLSHVLFYLRNRDLSKSDLYNSITYHATNKNRFLRTFLKKRDVDAR